MNDYKNIAFHYLYRDGANYKSLNTVIFSNPSDVNLETLEGLLKDKLISEEYFYANDLQVPDMHFGTWDNEIDHMFHEFECIEYTDEPANSTFTLAEFIGILKSL